MGYCDTTHVAALCSALVSGSADFSTDTNPTKAMVQVFISSGCAFLDALTRGKGYAPPASSNALYDLYRHMNALYAAWFAERRRTTDRTAPGEKSRADLLYNDLKAHIQMVFGADLDTLDLASAGLSPVNEVGPYGGGISKDDIEAFEDDEDRMPPRFVRGMSSAFRDTQRPSKVSRKD